MFYSTEWAPGTSQVMSDQHSRPQMMVPIPKLRRIPAGIASWFRRPRSAPDCNQQTPLRKCTSCTSPSKHLALSASKSEPATFAAQPINAVAGSINMLEQVDCSDVWRLNKSRQGPQRLSETHMEPE